MNDDYVCEMCEMCVQFIGVEEVELCMFVVDLEGMYLQVGGVVYYLCFDEICDIVCEVVMQMVMLIYWVWVFVGKSGEQGYGFLGCFVLLVICLWWCSLELVVVGWDV